MTDNFNEIDFEEIEKEGEAGSAFKTTCDNGYTFLKEERKKAEDEVKKFLDKRADFDIEGSLTNIKEVFKNGFNWYLIDYLYESGVVHYLHTNNKFFKDIFCSNEELITLFVRLQQLQGENSIVLSPLCEK